MSVFVNTHPTVPGYYWVVRKGFSKEHQVVYLNRFGVVLEVGSRQPLTPYNDIESWGIKRLESGRPDKEME